jgi:hypothetical protein
MCKQPTPIVQIYDLKGRLIRSLPLRMVWDGIAEALFDGDVPPGRYLAEVRGDGACITALFFMGGVY